MIHPIFDRFQWTSPREDGTWRVNALAARSRLHYDANLETAPWSGAASADNPVGFHEEIFEWIDLLESVVLAQDRYTMIELGAGYGRWIANAAAALRQTGVADYRFVGVEADASHFQWLSENLADNAVNLSRCTLIKAAVNADGKTAHFTTGDPALNYGQYIYYDDMRVLSRIKRFLRGSQSPTRKVTGISLASILAPLDTVDLIDSDVQGEEEFIFAPCLSALTRKVKRLHVETHHVRAEEALREQFGGAGWRCLNDHPVGTTRSTPYGDIVFQGGVQTWLNPAFVRA